MNIEQFLEEVKRSPFEDRLFFLAGICDEIPSILKKYFISSGNASYIDTVVGLKHDVDIELPGRALNFFKEKTVNKTCVKNFLKEYLEPVVALQDSDFEISDPNMRLGYYAIYNLLRYADGESNEEQFGLIVNQALSCLFGTIDEPEQFDEHVLKFMESKFK